MIKYVVYPKLGHRKQTAEESSNERAIFPLRRAANSDCCERSASWQHRSSNTPSVSCSCSTNGRRESVLNQRAKKFGLPRPPCGRVTKIQSPRDPNQHEVCLRRCGSCRIICCGYPSNSASKGQNSLWPGSRFLEPEVRGAKTAPKKTVVRAGAWSSGSSGSSLGIIQLLGLRLNLRGQVPGSVCSGTICSSFNFKCPRTAAHILLQPNPP